jgi:hypothetical protein
MTDESLAAMLRAVIPPTDASAVPPAGLWRRIVAGPGPARRWPWLDLGLAAAATGALLLRPDLFLVLF